VIVFCAALFILPSGEPIYHGKSLSAWLANYPLYPNQPIKGLDGKYRAQTRAELEEIESAVRNMGTKALPSLVEWVRAEDNPKKLELMAFLDKHPRIPLHLRPSREKNQLALRGFRVLGRLAQPAAPDLLQLLKNDNELVRMRAAIALQSIKSEPARAETFQEQAQRAFERSLLRPPLSERP
jgi:hypothetical protein